VTATRIVHLSDLHFGRVDADVTAALIDDIRGLRPDLVVVSGDLTMAARRAEFRAARAFLDALGAPWLAVPGNHDISPFHLLQRFVDPFRRWRRFIAAEIEPSWCNGHATVIGLNSARSAGWSLDWSAGRLNRAQLDKLTGRLGRSTAPVRIVVTHHPLVAPEDTRRSGLLGRAELALRFFRAHRIDLVMAGHLHRSFRHELQHSAQLPGVTATGGQAQPAASRAGMIVLLAGSATSTRLREGANSYHVVTVQRGELDIARRVWTAGGWQADGPPLRDADEACAWSPPGSGQAAAG
jgi:3',5'-cyclic AMP phosphodiesterase CpdA